jgi:peptidoglycan-associated lipoprotein
MLSRSTHVTLASVLVFGVLLAGCAKRPATTQAAAPPPTAAAATTPGAGSGAAQPATMAPSDSGSSSSGAATTSPSTAQPAARPSPKEFVSISDLKDVHFDFDKYDIRPPDAKVLDANATWLKSNPEHLVLIEGHCDERGTGTYNIALGERRAKATQNYLAAQGIQTARMAVLSYGEERPQCADHSENCWAKNRRAHFMVKAQ